MHPQRVEQLRGRRVIVVGSSGSGKTTTARRLAYALGVPHIELDALHWEPNWQEAATDVMRERVATAIQSDAWVIDGNYSQVRDLTWTRADSIIWLDYSLPVILWRLTRRTFRRVLQREELWGGNRERFRNQFFSRDSLYLWVLQTYRKRRRDYPLLFQRPEYAHLQIIHLRSPRATTRWLQRWNDAADAASPVINNNR